MIARLRRVFIYRAKGRVIVARCLRKVFRIKVLTSLGRVLFAFAALNAAGKQ
jgi:hypothetical protein